MKTIKIHDRILTKSNQKHIIKIGKRQNTIIDKGEIDLEVTIADIEIYLNEVKCAINSGKYRVEMNNKRQDNQELFIHYVINEEKRKHILLSLTPLEFCKILQNEHKRFEHELLYVFGKDVKLLQRFGETEKNVSLYIKLNKLENQNVIVISFHEQKYPLKYKFQ